MSTKTTPIKNRINKENLRRTRGKKMKKRNMSETPTNFLLPRGKENVSKRMLLFSGKKKGKTPVSFSNGENKDQQDAVPMEIDPPPPSGHLIYVKKEGDDNYFAVNAKELTTSKISEAVTLELQLNGTIGDIKLRDKRRSIPVQKDDGSVEERDLKEGDLTLLLKWENDQNSYTLSEQ